MESTPLIHIHNLSIFFDKEKTKQGFSNVHLSIPQGQITALIGASGSGKSITSLALMGLLPAMAVTEGSIYFGAEQIDLLSLQEKEWRSIRGKDIAMVFQEPMSALNPLMTCGAQMVECALAHQDISHQAAKELCISWLEKVQIPEPAFAFHKYPHQMSGGQKQRVMIAMAMINAPRLLIADEPSTALDVLVQQEIIHLLKDLQSQHGTTVLFITHDLALAQSIADDIIEMKNGTVVPRTLLQEKAQFKLSNTPDHLPPLLQVKNVSVQYSNAKGVFKAVDRVSLELRKGETVGLIGGSGCGKTTLSKAILGLEQVVEGHILYEGKDITHSKGKEWRSLRKQIQIIYQDPFASLNPRMKIGEAIAAPIILHLARNKSEAKAQTLTLLHQVGLQATDYDKYPHEFSGGQRQRICIARALAVKPAVVICDESVAALDIIVQKQILDLLMELQAVYGLTYLFITHDINVVKNICDRVVVMESGKIIESGKVKDVIQQPKEKYTQALIDAVPL